MQENGVGVEALTPAALGDRYPALETSGIEVAGLARDAGVLDPDEVVATLAEQPAKRVRPSRLAPRSPSIRRRPSNSERGSGVRRGGRRGRPANEPLVADAASRSR